MRNLRIEIEYDGTNYCGWQIQKSHQVTKSPSHQRKSIQEIIEKALQKILQKKIRLIVSGRTDAGVHAIGQVANFKTNSSISLEKLQRALNGLLPDDIVIKKMGEADLDFHSRFDAISKVYRYTILNRSYPSPLLRNKLYFCPYPLDIKLMKHEARCLLGRHNFKSFCASGSSVKDTVRTIKKLTIKQQSYQLSAISYQPKKPELIVIGIEADGFLYNMVRNIVGTLIEIGRGRFKKGDLKKILISKDRKSAGPAAPAKGLTLIKVNY